MDPFAEQLTATRTALDAVFDDLHIALTDAGIPFDPLETRPAWYTTLESATQALETHAVNLARAIDDRAQLLEALDQINSDLGAVTQFDRPAVMIASIRDAQHLATTEATHKQQATRTEDRPPRSDPPIDREARNRKPAPIYIPPPPPAPKPDPPTEPPVDPPAPVEPDAPKPARKTVGQVRRPADG